MKTTALLIFSLFIFTQAFTQVVLTYRNNAPLPGDTLITYDIDLTSPGTAGPGQVWDFSGLQISAEKNMSCISAKPSRMLDGISGYNTILTDRGNEYFYKIDEKSSEMLGLFNKDLSIVLTDPIVKMKYPVLFGTRFTDEYSGSGPNKYNSDVAISGEFTIEADACGTIILHDRIIKDALRIKSEEKKIQINPCNIYEIKSTSYTWYVPSSRYPVIGMTTRELKSNGAEPVVTHTAFINPQMANAGILLAGSADASQDASDASLILYPNPFIETLYYNYYLRRQMPVTVELVDMNGKNIITLAREQVQSEGFHTGDLDALKHDLKMGVYYFRFTFGDKVLVSKVVKM